MVQPLVPRLALSTITLAPANIHNSCLALGKFCNVCKTYVGRATCIPFSTQLYRLCGTLADGPEKKISSPTAY